MKKQIIELFGMLVGIPVHQQAPIRIKPNPWQAYEFPAYLRRQALVQKSR